MNIATVQINDEIVQCARCRQSMSRASLLLFNNFYLLCDECAVEYQQECREMRDE